MLFAHLLIDGHLCWVFFHLLAVIILVLWVFSSFVCITGRVIAGLCIYAMFHCFGNCQTVCQAVAKFHMCVTSLYSQQHLVISIFLKSLYGHHKCEVISHYDFYFISLMTNYVKHLFMWLLNIWTFSWENCLFNIFPTFKLCYRSSYIELQEFFIYFGCKCLNMIHK